MPSPSRQVRPELIWLALAAAMVLPVILAAFSPYLAYRNAPYIIGGFAGIVGLALLLIQPLLAGKYLGLRFGSRWHRRTGTAIVLCVALHIGGLYMTSAADTLDALLLVAPTPFSVYGVIAMWGILATALLVALRHRLGLRITAWRILHNALALLVVVATVIHAVQIEGAMEPISKWFLCLAVLAVTVAVLADFRVIRPLRRRR